MSDGDSTGPFGRYHFVVAANRLPVDRAEGPDGQAEWRPSPAGWSPPWSR